MAILINDQQKQIDFGNPTSPTLAAITVMVWFNAVSSSNNDYIMSRASTASANNDSLNWNLGFRSSGRTRGRIRLNTTTYTVTTAINSFAYNSWNHVAIAWSAASANLILCLNGVQLDSEGTSSNDLRDGQDIVIGGREGSTSQNKLDGAADDARIYTRKLGVEEIMHIYQSNGRDGMYDDLFLHAQMNEKGEGQSVNSGDVKDYSPYQHPSTTKGSGTITYAGSFNSYTRRVA